MKQKQPDYTCENLPAPPLLISYFMPSAAPATNLSHTLCNKTLKTNQNSRWKEVTRAHSSLRGTIYSHGHSGSCQQDGGRQVRSYSLHFARQECKAQRGEGTEPA